MSRCYQMSVGLTLSMLAAAVALSSLVDAGPSRAEQQLESVGEVDSLSGAEPPFDSRNASGSGFELIVAESSPQTVSVGPAISDQSILRLTGMYYLALSEGRAADAVALEEALAAFGSPPSRPAPQLPNPAASQALDLRELRRFAPLAVRVRVTGSTSGAVWGADVYTDDSSLGAAAVHAGLVEPGVTKDVVVFIEGSRDAFSGSARHGVHSSQYGSWGGSFRLGPVSEMPDAPRLIMPVADSRTDPSNPQNAVYLTNLAGQDELKPGLRIVTFLAGNQSGSIWGTGAYTSDSSLTAAAVHSGVLEVGQTGPVMILIAPGQDSYEGSTQHGITSNNWGNYYESFRVLPLRGGAAMKGRRPAKREPPVREYPR